MTDKLFLLLLLILSASLDIAYFIFRVIGDPLSGKSFLFVLFLAITGIIFYRFTKTSGPLFQKKKRIPLFF